jgi:hypothetical protein
MLSDTYSGPWVHLPGGLNVLNHRLQKDGKVFSLYDASVMDIRAFNKKAARYSVRIESSDWPIVRMVKYVACLSSKWNDGSFLPSNAGYNSMVQDVAVAKAREQEPLASVYGTLTDGTMDVTKDVVVFREKLPDGKHRATLLRFAGHGLLSPVEDITVAETGRIKTLGEYGYPTETIKEPALKDPMDNPKLSGLKVRIEGIDPVLSGTDAIGHWEIGQEPVNGEQRIVTHKPDVMYKGIFSMSAAERLSCTSNEVSALLLSFGPDR